MDTPHIDFEILEYELIVQEMKDNVDKITKKRENIVYLDGFLHELTDRFTSLISSTPSDKIVDGYIKFDKASDSFFTRDKDLEDIYEQLDVMINQYTTFTIDSLAELNALIDNFGLTIKANTTLKNIRKSESELIEKINKMLDHLEDTIKLQIQNTSIMIYIVEDL